jgi:hypothetical protein
MPEGDAPIQSRRCAHSAGTGEGVCVAEQRHGMVPQRQLTEFMSERMSSRPDMPLWSSARLGLEDRGIDGVASEQFIELGAVALRHARRTRDVSRGNRQ